MRSIFNSFSFLPLSDFSDMVYVNSKKGLLGGSLVLLLLLICVFIIRIYYKRRKRKDRSREGDGNKSGKGERERRSSKEEINPDVVPHIGE